MFARTVSSRLLLGCLALTAGLAGARAEDRDEFYAIARGERGARPPASQAQSASRGFGIPGFSLFGAAPHRALPEITVRPPAAGPATRSPGASRAGAPAGESAGGPRAYCVRTCDGFFFPAGPALSGEGRRSQQEACSSLCPGADVAVYTVGRSGGIEAAVGPHGQTYAALRTAFRFREGLERTCSCRGSPTAGLAHLPITHDVTLRAGDLVVTEAGVRVFRGGARFPYRSQDFVEARSYGRLPADVRRRVEEIQAGIQNRDAAARDRTAPAGRLGRLTTRAPAAPAPAGPPQASATTTAESVRVLDLSRRGPAPTLR